MNIHTKIHWVGSSIRKRERMNIASCNMLHIDRSQEYTRPEKFLQKERSAICMQ